MKRRTALVRLALGMLGSCCGLVSCARFRRKLGSDAAVLDDLLYTEQGVPVLLLGENLAPTRTHSGKAMEGEGKKLAAKCRDIVDVYLQKHPAATASDVPKLVELLALEEFGAGKSK